jgi:hypothetical protein
MKYLNSYFYFTIYPYSKAATTAFKSITIFCIQVTPMILQLDDGHEFATKIIEKVTKLRDKVILRQKSLLKRYLVVCGRIRTQKLGIRMKLCSDNGKEHKRSSWCEV